MPFPYTGKRRFFRAALAGLTAPNQTGGFFGGLQAGLGGTMAYGQQEEAAAQKAEEERLRRDLEERLFGLKQRETAAEEMRALADKTRSEREGGKSGGFGFDEWLAAPQNVRDDYKTYKNVTDNPVQPPAAPQFSAADRARINSYKRNNPKATDDDAAVALFGADKPAELKDLNTFVDNFRADPDIKNYTVVRDNYRRIEANAKLGTGQGDLAVIFSFMRVLDPESVVRETEFKNAQEAVGRLQMMTNIPSQWIKGNRLTPEGRAGFRQAAKALHDTQRKTYETKAGLYKRQAEAYKVDPTLIIPNYGDAGGSGADLIYNPQTGQLEPAR